MYYIIQLPNTSPWLSGDAILLACQLMTNLEIPQGTNLAKILRVNSIFYNDEAIRVWVQRQLDDGLVVDDYALSTLETAFIELVSIHSDHVA